MMTVLTKSEVNDLLLLAKNSTDVRLWSKLTHLSSRMTEFDCYAEVSVKLQNPAQHAIKSDTSWERYHKRYGLPADGLGKQFTIRRSRFTVVGISPSRPKYPIDAINHNGREFKFTVGQFQTYLKS